MKNFLRLMFLGMAVAVSAHAAVWTENYASALAQAKMEKKNLLLDFTGSDWCGWCMKMDKEVFSQPSFNAYADKSLILVKVDFPHKRPLDAATKSQNQSLKKKYSIGGYPTFILLDSDEKRLFKQEGYLPGGPNAFISALDKK